MPAPEDVLAWWDGADEALCELRACRTAAEIEQRACALVRRGCRAEAVLLGTLRGRTWWTWCQAGWWELFGDGDGDDTDSTDASTACRAADTGRLAHREFGVGRRHVVVPVPASDDPWLLQLVAPADPGDVGLELAESFAAAIASTMTLAALIRRAKEQQFVLARLAGGVGHGVERAVELADTPLPDRGSPVRGALATPPSSSVGDRLSPRQQREVLALLLQGLSNAEIAERLVVSLATVKSHVSAVLRVCGAANRSDAITRLTRGDAASP